MRRPVWAAQKLSNVPNELYGFFMGPHGRILPIPVRQFGSVAKQLPRKKLRSEVLVPDASGQMRAVPDRRFDDGPWPISFVVPVELSETWLHYLGLECSRRNWSNPAITQLGARGNSGSVSIASNEHPDLTFDLVWERAKDGPLAVRSRSSGRTEFPVSQLQAFFEAVNVLCAGQPKGRFWKRSQLSYYGLPWKGEYWLNDQTRLGPPSIDNGRVLIAPRRVIVDMELEAIDAIDAVMAQTLRVREISAFLSVLLGTHFGTDERDGRQVWVLPEQYDVDWQCELRTAGYVERGPGPPVAKGTSSPIPTFEVARPVYKSPGIRLDDDQESLPADTASLFALVEGLEATVRARFLQVARLLQLALHLGEGYLTTGFALTAVAVESLKPQDKAYRDHGLYEVVRGLLGQEPADFLKTPEFQAQRIRSDHLHYGTVMGSELMKRQIAPSFQDPSFEAACRELMVIARAAAIEWLKVGGSFMMPPLRKQLKRARNAKADPLKQDAR